MAKRLSDLEKRKIKRLHSKGYSILAISNELNRSDWTIKKYINEMQLTKPKKIMDLTGERYGKLVVLELDHIERSIKYWKCKCDCGNIKIARQEHLKEGKVKSCGCIRRGRLQTIAKVKVAPVKAKKQDNPRGRGHFGLFTQDIVLKGDYTEEKNKLYGEVKEYKMSKEELAEYLSKMSTREVTRRK